MVVDPVARLTDGESVRIARDVLCAGAPGAKVCLPEDQEETARVLARRGGRRPVLVGNDRALLRAVEFLRGDGGEGDGDGAGGREAGAGALGVVPVGAAPTVALAHALGVPADTVSAARAVLGGAERRLDLLVDDAGAVVLGGLHIPAAPSVPAEGDDGRRPWRRVCRSLVRTVLPPGPRGGLLTEPADGPGPAAQPLRVEADGRVLAEPGLPVTEVSVRTRGTCGFSGPEPVGPGFAEVTVRTEDDGADAEAAAVVRAREVVVSGAAFRYRADARVDGPVLSRTWTVVPEGWRLVLPKAG